jgi:hypothetical protein
MAADGDVGIAAALALVVASLIGIFVIEVGDDWYVNGHLRICLPEDVTPPPLGHYSPPASAAEMNTPAYWCKRMQLLYQSGEAEQNSRDKENYSIACAPMTPDASSEPKNMNAANETVEEQQQEANDVLLNATVNNTCFYRGTNRFWGNTAIDIFLQNAFQLLYRWASEAVEPWFESTAAPLWNEHFAADGQIAESHRNGLAWFVGVILSGIVCLALAAVVNWLRKLS